MPSSHGDDPLANNALPEKKDLIAPYNRFHHDLSVKFDEYHYYAQQTRAEERETAKKETATRIFWQVLFPTKSAPGVTPISTKAPSSPQNSSEEKIGISEALSNPSQILIAEAEWKNASRAVRTACFYLITTDVLGPFGLG